MIESAIGRQQLLRDTKSVALVGASSNTARPSFFVATYLLSSTTYRVYFVNPRLDTLLGHEAYPTLEALPEVPDLVSVFRKHDDLPGVASEVVAVGAKTLWLQLGLEHPEARKLAEEAGLNVVMNRCVKIEHARFHGGLHLAGFNTGVITSRRSH